MSRIDHKRIRELCARVLKAAEGQGFREAVLELANALEMLDKQRPREEEDEEIDGTIPRSNM